MIPSQLLVFAFVVVPVISGEPDGSFTGTNEESGINSVGHVTPDLLEQLNISLFFENMELKELPTGFIKSEFLTHLSFEGSQIGSISHMAFGFVPRLRHLNLANNLLKNIDLHQFSMMESLQTLNLNGNCMGREKLITEAPVEERTEEYIHELSEEPVYGSNAWLGPGLGSQAEPEYTRTASTALCEINFSGQFLSLTKLYLENNDLTRVTFSMGMKLPLLTHLYLSGNQLNVDDDMMSNLSEFAPSLSNLYLEVSNINELDTSQLPTIMSLHLDRNSISGVCNEYCDGPSLKLRGARNLKTLSLSQNRISKIEPDSFNHTTSLVILDLSHNKISEIREGTFEKLYLLRVLSLEHNNLVKPTELYALRRLPKIENLSLGYNNLWNISAAAFATLATLKTLTLDYNGISGIDSGAFSKLTSLETLSLAGNRLSKIPDGCMPTSDSLVTLNLNNNKFTSTEYISFVNLPNLLFLYLRDNPLTTMTVHWHSDVSKNLTINLGNHCLDEETTKNPYNLNLLYQ